MKTSLIITCDCGDTDKFAEQAFKILFPGELVPPINHTHYRTNNDAIKQVITALKKSEKKFAYCFRGGEEDFEVWDLLKGKRVK